MLGTRTVRPFFLAWFVLPLLLTATACGKGASDAPPQGDEDSGPHPHTDAGPISMCNTPPGFTCPGACGETVLPLCENGEWSCDDIGGGGSCPDAGPCGPTGLMCFACGSYYSPTCGSDGWTCSAVHCVEDSGPGPCGVPPICPVSDSCTLWSAECSPDGWECIPTDLGCDDASVDAPVDDGGADVYEPPFSCGDTACDPTTSFCVLLVGGPVEDGGTSSNYDCFALPQTCEGQPASCACVSAGETAPGACGCIESGDHVIVTCDLQ